MKQPQVCNNNNNLLSHSPPRTINNKVFSNLFFELSPKNSLPAQFNKVQNMYSNFVNKRSMDYFNLKTMTNHEQFKNRIMNELNYIYDKISTVQSEPTEPFQITENKKETNPNTIFSTEVNKVKIKRDTLEDVQEENVDVLQGKEAKQPIFPEKKYIILGKAKPYRRNIEKKCHNKFITFYDVKCSLPNYPQHIIKKNLETYQILDKLEAKKKPSFKY